MEILGNEKSNVVFFPGVYDTLLKNAQASMEACDYENTIKYCEQALEINQQNEMLVFALVFSLYELRQLEKAKDTFENYSETNRIENPDLHFYYLSILVEMKCFKEARKHLNAMVFQRVVNEENQDQYDSISRLVDIMNIDEVDISDHTEEFDDYVQNAFVSGSSVEISLCVEQLYEANIRRYLDLIKEYLIDDSNNLLLKSQLLEIMINQQVNEIISVTKFGKTVRINPADAPYIDETDFLLELSGVMRKLYENNDPSKYQLAFEKINFHNTALFPLDFDYKINSWTKAYDMYFRMAFGESMDEDVTDADLEKFNFILELESLLDN